jgi:hypothetical protein
MTELERFSMTELEFQVLERWVFAAANAVQKQELCRGQVVIQAQNLYNQRRAEARAMFVQPKETAE